MCILFFHPCKCSCGRLYFPWNGCCSVFHPSYSSRSLTSMFLPMSLGRTLPRPRPTGSGGGDAAWLQRLGHNKVSWSALVFLGHLLWEPSHHAVRKRKLAHVKGPRGKARYWVPLCSLWVKSEPTASINYQTWVGRRCRCSSLEWPQTLRSRDRPSPWRLPDPNPRNHEHNEKVISCHEVQGSFLCRNNWISTQNKRQRFIRKPGAGVVCKTLIAEAGGSAGRLREFAPQGSRAHPFRNSPRAFLWGGWGLYLLFLGILLTSPLRHGAWVSSCADLDGAPWSLQGLNAEGSGSRLLYLSVAQLENLPSVKLDKKVRLGHIACDLG